MNREEKDELKRIDQMRKMAKASIDFSRWFEEFCEEHKLDLLDAVQLLDEQFHVYLRAKVKRRWF
jgi:hypothetical protein